MIVIVYDPPETDMQKWELHEDSWTYGEIVEIERLYGGNRDDFFSAVQAGNNTARQILLLVVRQRTEPDLKLEDLNSLKVAYVTFLVVKEKAATPPKAPAKKAAAKRPASRTRSAPTS